MPLGDNRYSLLAQPFDFIFFPTVVAASAATNPADLRDFAAHPR